MMGFAIVGSRSVPPIHLCFSGPTTKVRETLKGEIFEQFAIGVQE